MNAIQKAIALLRNPPVGSEDLHDNFSVADELEALLKQEPVGRVDAGKYRASSKGGPNKWRENKGYSGDVYRAPCTPCDLKALEEDVDWLSNVIRHVDGNHSLGAGELAEKIVDAIIAKHARG